MRKQVFQNIVIAISLTSPLANMHAQQGSSSVTTATTSRIPAAATAPTSVPALVPYSGAALDSKGKPLAGEASVTFLIYKDQQGGEPVFAESQMVAFDETGHYKVQLGAGNSNGLPSDLFSSGEARWLEVQIAGQPAEPRALLASVPYALKAADAATLGGLPASAFALAGSNGAVVNGTAGGITSDATAGVTTTGGTANKLAKFSGGNSIVNSLLYDNGTNVGIGTTTPGALLTVNGNFTSEGIATFNGQALLPASGTATASSSHGSQPFKFNTSAYNSSTKAVVPPRFQLQAEPINNNTSSPGATFNFLASTTSAAPAETGLYFNTNGTIHFASSQTFPAIDSTGTVSGTSSSGTGVQGTSSSGTGVQGTSSSGTGVAGSSNSADGVLGYTSGGTLNTGGVVGQATGRSGFSGIAGVWGDSTVHTGVYGTSTQAQGVLGESTNGVGVQGVSTYGVGVQATSSNSVAGLFSTGSPSATIAATNTASNGGQAFNGVAQGSYGIAVYASETGTDGTGVEAFGNGNGVIGDTSGGVLQTAGVLGIAGSRTGVGGIAGVWGDAEEHVGVIGSSKDYNGVYGFTSTGANTAAVYGVGQASLGPYLGTGAIGVWGDISGANAGNAAVVGTATDAAGGYFQNNSSSLSTIIAYNYNDGGGITSNVSFKTFQASTSTGTCGFGGNGDMTCTGQVKSLATTGNGARTVETYSMQSPENWMEDFGSGTLQSGVTRVLIEASFAETVSGNADYHVFLTPQGDSKGLYVTNKTATSFEVHESGGGVSAIGFDYRIVAKRRGFEAQRMVDVTEAMNEVRAGNVRRAEQLKITAK